MISADTLAVLMAKGLAGDDLLEVVRSIDADQEAVAASAPKQSEQAKTSGAERMRRYRQHRVESGMVPGFSGAPFIERLIARDGEGCAYCGKTEYMAVDHMVPVCQGGTDDLDNLCQACRVCNSFKAGRTPSEAGMSFVKDTAKTAHENFVLRTCSRTDPAKVLPSLPYDINSTPHTPLKNTHIRARELLDSFWAIYPKRINRKAALAKLETVLKAGVDPEKILDGARRYAEHVKFMENQYVKAPDAWLNAGKWDDELPSEPQRPPARAGPRSSTNGVVEMLNELNGVSNAEPAYEQPPKDITPAAAPEPGGRDPPAHLFESPRRSSVSESLDLRPASSDRGGPAAPYLAALRTG